MTPGQLNLLADVHTELHSAAGDGDAGAPATPPSTQGTTGDLLAFAAMPRR